MVHLDITNIRRRSVLVLIITLVTCVSAFNNPTTRSLNQVSCRRIKSHQCSLFRERPIPLPSVTSSAQYRASKGGIVDLRYSDFLKLINKNRLSKVTFSSDGAQLVGIDKEGRRMRINALPNDPSLLKELTSHKVDITVLPVEARRGGFLDFLSSIFLPIAFFAGLFL